MTKEDILNYLVAQKATSITAVNGAVISFRCSGSTFTSHYCYSSEPLLGISQGALYEWLNAKLEAAEFDPVNHPKHYTSHPSGVECIQVTEHMNFNIGNAVKYLWRSDHKGAKIEDLKKARWYLDREIARLEKA